MVEKGGTPGLRYKVILTNPIIVELSEAPPVHSQMIQISFWLCNPAPHQVVVVRGRRVSVASTPPSKTLQRISSTKHPPRCNFQRHKKCFRFETISSSGPSFFLVAHLSSELYCGDMYGVRDISAYWCLCADMESFCQRIGANLIYLHDKLIESDMQVYMEYESWRISVTRQMRNHSRPVPFA